MYLVRLVPWSEPLKEALIENCNAVDRRFLSDRIPNPYTEESARWYLSHIAEHEGKDALYRAIECDGKIIGSVSVEQKDGISRKDAEIGYYILSEFHGKGIVSRVVKIMCDLAFEKLDIVRITGECFAPNVGSARVLEHNGFELEGIKKKAIYKDGNFHDLCIYGKLK